MWINNRSVDLYELEHRPYMRGGGGEGSNLGTFELKKSPKTTFSFLFVITQNIKELVSRKFREL